MCALDTKVSDLLTIQLLLQGFPERLELLGGKFSASINSGTQKHGWHVNAKLLL